MLAQISARKLASLPGWLWGNRHERIIRNSYLSLLGWLLMYGVFYFEVSHLNLDSQHAKLTISPLGAPLGLTIQWLVFRDRVETVPASQGFWSKPKQVWGNALRASRLVGSRWVGVKLVSFALNQYAYAMMLHAVGLPYLVAYPAAAAALSLIYYKMNNVWVFTDRWWDGPVMGWVCYQANNLWLTWNLGSFLQAEV